MRRLALIPAALAATFAAAPALADGPYASFASGGNFARDQQYEAAPDARYDSGGIGALSAGYIFRSGWRPELEVTHRDNDATSAATTDVDAVMANLWYEIRTLPFSNHRTYPYAGLGAGSADLRVEQPGAASDVNDTVFAWQAGVGVGYDATPRLALSLGYRYFETEDVPGLRDTPYRSDAVLAGLRYTFGRGGARRVAAAQPAAAPPQAEVAAFETVVLRPVNFQFDEAGLTGAALEILDAVAARLTAHPDVRVVIEGHTDAIGPDAYNDKLGKDRADQVGKYLVHRGVDPARIETVSRGESEPIADNATPEGRATNRRAELDAPEPPPKVKVVIEGPSEASVQAADDAKDPGR